MKAVRHSSRAAFVIDHGVSVVIFFGQGESFICWVEDFPYLRSYLLFWKKKGIIAEM